MNHLQPSFLPEAALRLRYRYGAFCFLLAALFGMGVTVPWMSPLQAAPTAVTLAQPVSGSYGSSVQLSWTRSYENNLASYCIYRATHQGVTEQDDLVSSVNAGDAYGDPVSGYDWNAPAAPAPGTTYYYRVFAVDQAGQGSGSNEKSITLVDAAPGTATLEPLSHSEGYYGPQVGLSWSQNGEYDFSSYKVYRATHAGVTQADDLIATQTYQGNGTAGDYNILPAPAPGTTYYYRVFVWDQGGQSSGSNEKSITLVDSVPTAVTLAEPQPGTYGGVQLSWTRSYEYDLAAYKVYRATHTGVTEADELITTVNAGDASGDPVQSYDYNAPALPLPGVTYSYRVFSVDNAGQSSGSNEESVERIDTPPGAVTLAQPTAANGYFGSTVHLEWTRSAESDIASYKLYRATHEGVSDQDALVATVSSADAYTNPVTCDDSGALASPAPGTTYYYKVYITDQAGQSTAGNEQSLTLVDAVPNAVTLAAPQPGSYPGQVQLSWTRSYESDLASYRLYRATHAGVTEADTLVATVSAGDGYGNSVYGYDSVNGLNGTFHYRVFVIDAAGQSAGSNEESLHVGGVPEAPVAPTFSIVTDTGVRVIVPALPGGATTLSLQKKVAGQADETYITIAQGLAGGAVADVAGLTAITTYTFRAVAVGDEGETAGPGADVTPGSDNTPVPTPTPVPVTPPAAPLNLVAEAEWEQVTLHWDASTGATGYHLYRSVQDGGPYALLATVTATATANAYADQDVEAGTAYFYVVRAINSAGESADSNQATARPLADTTPPQVSIAQPLNGSTVNSLPLVGGQASDPLVEAQARSGLSHLLLSVSRAQGDATLYWNGTAWAQTPSPLRWDAPGPNATDWAFGATLPHGMNLVAGLYHLSVRAYDRQGNASAPDEVSVTVAPNAPPAAVTLDEPVVTPYYSNFQVGLLWSQSDAEGFGEYRVYRATHETVTPSDELVCTYTNTGYNATTDYAASAAPLPGATYHYRVFVYDAEERYSGSNERAVTLVDAVPEAVTLLQPQPGYYGNDVRLSWTRAADYDIGTYKVYRATHPSVTAQDALVTTVGGNNAYGDPIEGYDYNAPASPAPGTTYYYRVLVCDSAGQSAWSNEQSLVQLNSFPTAVTLQTPVEATYYSPSVQLSWTQNADYDFGTYQLYRAEHPNVTEADTLVATLASQSSTQTWDSQVTAEPEPGATYYYRIFVHDLAGQSSGSNEQSITLVDARPAAVTLYQPQAGSNPDAVSLSWSRNYEYDIAEYRVYRATEAEVTGQDELVATVTAGSTYGDTVMGDDTTAVPGPPPGVTYYYRVFVIDNAGQSTGSNEQSILKIDAVDNPRPLLEVFEDRQGEAWNDIIERALGEAENKTLKYSSTPVSLPAYQTFEGAFSPREGAGATTRLAIFSDDGSDVKVWDVTDPVHPHIVISHAGCDHAQELPQLDQSLHQLECELVEGHNYWIRVRYSNLSYQGENDVDGATLFAYSQFDDAPFTQSPDALISAEGAGGQDAEFKGDDIYNVTGEKQTIEQNAWSDLTTGGIASYHVRVQNDGAVPMQLRVRARAGGEGWTVLYSDSGIEDGEADITAAITAEAGWLTPLLAPGETHDIRVDVAPDETVESGTDYAVPVYVYPAADDSILESV